MNTETTTPATDELATAANPGQHCACAPDQTRGDDLGADLGESAELPIADMFDSGQDEYEHPAALATPLVQLIDGCVTTTSIQVAERFGRSHKNVLRAIRDLECSPHFHERNFAPIKTEVHIGRGNIRLDPAFRLTRDGFNFLCMGFTGAKAAEWKEAFIGAFNALEAEQLAAAERRSAEAPLPSNFGALLPTLLPLLAPVLPALMVALTAWLSRAAQPPAPTQPDYMAEPWFQVLLAVCVEHPRVDVARALGVSAPFLSQILNGSGKYGRGEASTHHLAERVRRKFINLKSRTPMPPGDGRTARRTTVTVEH